MSRLQFAALAILTLAVLAPCDAQDKSAQAKPSKKTPAFPGPTEDGYVLPNGWKLTPAGEQITLTDLPLNIRATPDSRYALVATNGYEILWRAVTGGDAPVPPAVRRAIAYRDVELPTAKAADGK